MIDSDGHDFEPGPSFQLLEYYWQEGRFDMINQLPARTPTLVFDWGNFNGTIARGRDRVYSQDPIEYEKSKHNKSKRVMNDLRHFHM